MILTNDKLETFLQPIAEGRFAGRYLKLEGAPYRAIRNDFNQAQTALRALTDGGLGNDALRENNIQQWQKLADHLAQSLTRDTKDIELLGWFIAAQIVLDPTLDAFANAMQLLHNLVEHHFDELHPTLPPEKTKSDDPQEQQREVSAFRMHALLPMLGDSDTSGLLFMPLQLADLVGDISYFRYQSAERQRQLDTLQNGIHLAVANERDVISQRLLNLGNAADTVDALDTLLEATARRQEVTPPNFMHLKYQLKGMIQSLEQMTGIMLESLKPKASEVIEHSQEKSSEEITSAKRETVETVAMSNHQTRKSADGGYTRASAYQELRHIADFFKRTEPHSPVPYLLDKAIRWGAMPLDDLLTELLKGQHDIRDAVFNLTGLDEASHPAAPLPVNPPAETHTTSISESVEKTTTVETTTQPNPKTSSNNPISTGNSQLW